MYLTSIWDKRENSSHTRQQEDHALFIYLLGFIYTIIYNNHTNNYAIVNKIVYVRISNTGNQHPN